MSRDDRKQIIREIEDKRETKVIAYVTSDRPGLAFQVMGDVVSIIHEHILRLDEDNQDKLDLFIYSRGGQSDVPWTIVSMFREYAHKGSFSVLIPYRAHSAATVIALGADDIVMTKKAELGPIDITIQRGPYNPRDEENKAHLPVSVEDVMGYFSLMERVGCERPNELREAFKLLTGDVHPLALGRVSRLLEETKLTALRLLNTRADRFSEDENHEIVDRISSEVYSHQHAISRTEAFESIGLKQVRKAEDAGVADELWALYEQYRDLFCLEEPFRPEQHLVSNELEEKTWTDLSLGCVESVARFDTFKQSRRVRKLRKVPPQVKLELSLKDLKLPTVNLPSLPAEIETSQIQELVKQVTAAVVQQSMNSVVQDAINKAAQTAADRLVQSLPQAGFETTRFDTGWKKEDEEP